MISKAQQDYKLRLQRKLEKDQETARSKKHSFSDDFDTSSQLWSLMMRIIQNNRVTPHKPGMHKHHIYPKCASVLNGLPVDDSKENLVYLSFREHILVHFYMYQCVKPCNELLRTRLRGGFRCLVKNYVSWHVLHEELDYNHKWFANAGVNDYLNNINEDKLLALLDDPNKLFFVKEKEQDDVPEYNIFDVNPFAVKSSMELQTAWEKQWTKDCSNNDDFDEFEM